MRLLAAAPADRSHRHLPAGPAGPEGPDRGDRRRDRRPRTGRLRALDRPVGGRGRDDPPGRRRASDQRRPDRVLADLPRHRALDPAHLPRARDRDHRLRGALARADQRPLPRRRAAAGRRRPRPHAPLSGREPPAQPGAGRRVARDRRRQRRHGRAGRVRLGPVAREGHRAAGRRPPARSAQRGARRARARARPEDIERIEQAIPPDAAAGDRYGAPQMADLDSERS